MSLIAMSLYNCKTNNKIFIQNNKENKNNSFSWLNKAINSNCHHFGSNYYGNPNKTQTKTNKTDNNKEQTIKPRTNYHCFGPHFIGNANTTIKPSTNNNRNGSNFMSNLMSIFYAKDSMKPNYHNLKSFGNNWMVYAK